MREYVEDIEHEVDRKDCERTVRICVLTVRMCYTSRHHRNLLEQKVEEDINSIDSSIAYLKSEQPNMQTTISIFYLCFCTNEIERSEETPNHFFSQLYRS
jgi:hypothetical protein